MDNGKGAHDDDGFDDEYGSEGDASEDEDEDIERGDAGYTSDPEMATAKRDYQFGSENEGGRRKRA
jgi:hypothetical protein